MNHNVIETVLGAVVLIVAGVFLVFALGAADLRKVSGYDVTANFSKAEGIAPGLDVRISGVKIGSVQKTELDPKTYLAKITMSIKNDIKLPIDTVAKVSSESLLGGKYMALEPGAEDQMIKPGGQIQYTQASVNLEELIGKFIFSGVDKAPGSGNGNAASAPANNNSQPAPAAAGNAKQPFSNNY